MATPGELSDDDEDDKEKVLEKEISELRLVKKTLLEKARRVDEELEKVAQRERECVDEQHRLRAEKHDRDKAKQTVRRLVELESEIKRLKCANVACSEMNAKLKQSLNQATKHSRAQTQNIAGLNAKLSAEQQLHLQKVQAVSDTVASSIVEDLQRQLSETRERLSNTSEELKGTRERLSNVEERLTAAEQLTAATQQRELQESDNSEQLQLELNSHHQPTTHSGTESSCFILVRMQCSLLFFCHFFQLR